jgi:ferredoxin-NADP reductase
MGAEACLLKVDFLVNLHIPSMQPASPTDEDLGLTRMRLIDIRYAAAGIHLFEFDAVDGGHTLSPSTPGAHVDLHLPNGMVRQYSLLNPGDSQKSVVLGIKRDEAGLGGSKYIFDTLKVGDIVEIGASRNHFALDMTAAHTVLIAGGIGITPIMAMKNWLDSRGMSWEMHYACRSRDEMPFAGDLAGDNRARLHLDRETGRLLDIGAIVASAPADAHFYCCGPGPMLDAFKAATASRPPGHVHLEYFTARAAPKLGHGFTLELARSRRSIHVADGQTILDALNDAGVDVRFSCRGGVCGACETRVIEGIPEHRDSILTDEERAANETVMICCGGSRSERLVLDL